MNNLKASVVVATVFFLTFTLAVCADDKKPVSKIPEDKDFLAKALQGGNKEVMLGREALLKASHSDVKKFARRMIDDHSKANQELMNIAKDMKVAIVTEASKADRELAGRLAKATGDDFDRQYMKHMVEDHEQEAAEFEAYAKEGKNEKLRSFAAKTLPTVREHLRLAREINAKLKLKK
jgi:putative membrane protein